MSQAAITRQEVGVALWRAVDFDRSRVGDVNTLADAVLLLVNLAHEAGQESIVRPVRMLCDDSDAHADDPYVGMVSTADLRRVIERDGL